MLIRVEIPIDAPGIDALLRRSFESDAEAKLVHDLREDGFLTLGLVATDDEGQVIGYVAFSPVDVQGEDLQWVGMAPLAVDEKYRGQGLARQLVYEGLDSLNDVPGRRFQCPASGNADRDAPPAQSRNDCTAPDRPASPLRHSRTH